MIRKAIIIGAPQDNENEPFHQGVLTDIVNYNNYVKSPTGGAFHPTEIINLINPTADELYTTLKLNPADFVLLVFSGHGFFWGPSRKTIFDLNGISKVSLRNINKAIRAPKKLIIADTCRVQIGETYHHFDGIGDPFHYMNFPSDLSPVQARQMFNNVISQCKDGTQIIYSCAPGEKSMITSYGSHFSNSFLSSIKGWAASLTPNNNVLSGIQGFRRAQIYLKRTFGADQTPKLFARVANFPIAYKALKRSGFASNFGY